MSDDHEHTIQAFREAVGRGWSVIPLQPHGKRALIRWKPYQGKRAAWSDVLSWLGQWPDANVGIVTGEISGLVVLDEASSRLDPATERAVEQAVERLLQGRTAIIIAHRLPTVQRADKLLILERGQIVEFGLREELAADPGSRFAQLLRTGMEEALA